MGVLADRVDLSTLSAVVQKGNFSYNDVDSIHYGFTDKPLWFHLRYRYTEATATPLLLMLGNFTLHYVDFYFVKKGKLLTKRSMGQARPFARRYRALREFSSPLPVDTEPIDLYLRLKSATTIYFTPVVKQERQVIEKENWDQLIAGLIFGAQAVLILFNFFLFLSLKDRSYFLYSAYIFTWLAFELNNSGFLAKYILPNRPAWDARILPMTSLLLHGCFMLFAENFMRMKKGITRNILKYGGNALLLLSLPALFTPQPLTNRILLTLTLPVTLVILVHAYRAIRLKHPSSGYFLAATIVSLLVVPIFILTRIVELDTENYAINTFLFYAVPLTVVAEAILFSFALADRYHRLREQNEVQRMAFAAELKKERQQIFSELHDFIGSDLTLIMMKTADAKNKTMQELRERVMGISKSLRTLLELENVDPELPQKLASSIEGRSREVAQSCGMRLNLKLTPLVLSTRAAFHLQRFAYEALSNAMQHSGASQLTVKFYRRSEYVHLIVADDGVGIQQRAQGSGHGLKNLMVRARSLHGRARIFTRAQKGTAIILSFHFEPT